jgi:hypothetical protein
MYLGTKGELFFQTCIFLVLSILLCGSHFSYCTHQLYNSDLFWSDCVHTCNISGMTACALAPSAQTICHCTAKPQNGSSDFIPLQQWLHTSDQSTHSTSLHHWIDTSAMDTDAPPSEVTLPDGADSPLRHSSLLSAAAFADVVALTTSPAAAAASASTIVLEVSLFFLLLHHRI